MAVKKDSVLAAIESKFKGTSITKTFRENLASKWADKIESEDDIENYINDREDIILEAAGEADRRATEAAKKAAEKANKENVKPEDKKDEDLPDDTPEWAKAILKKNEALEARLNGYEQAQTQKTIAERFKSDERLKGMPEFMYKGRIPSKEEDYEAAVTELAGDYESWAKENNIQKFGNDKPGGNQGKTNDGKVSDLVKRFAETANKEVEKK